MKTTRQSPNIQKIETLSSRVFFLPRTRFLLKTIFIEDKKSEDKNPKLEHLLKTKNPRLVAQFTPDHTGDWGGRIKQNDSDWKFQS